MNAVRLFVPASLCALLCTASAEEADAPVRYVVEVYNLPTPMAHELVAQDIRGSELHARMLAALQAKQATLDKLMVGNSLRGRLSVKQTHDYQYPTEFDPPQLPTTLAIIKSGADAPPAEKAPAAQGGVSPFNAGLGNMTTTTPTAFEMRELGERLEIDRDRNDENGRLPVTCRWNSVRLKSVVQYGDLPAPVFAARKAEGAVLLAPGEPAFLGTCGFARRSGALNAQMEEVTSLAFVTAMRDVDAPAEAVAQKNPFAPKSNLLRVKLEVVSMDKAGAHALMLERLEESALQQRVAELIEKQQARRETTLVVRGSANQPLHVANANEIIEPTEFDPPQVPMTLILANRGLLRDIREGRQTGLGAWPPKEGEDPFGGFGLITTLSPTAFEMYPLGEQMEVRCAINGEMYDVAIDARFCRRMGEVPYNGLGHSVLSWQRLSSEVRVKPNQPVLVGTLNPAFDTGFAGSPKEERIWLAFLRVTAK